MLSPQIRSKLVKAINEFSDLGSEINIKESGVSGGCINKCYKWQTEKLAYFIKQNSFSAFPEMFEKEIKGLSILEGTRTLRIPQQVGLFHIDNISFLVLEFINPSPMKPNFWEHLAKGLAQLHKNTDDNFGLDHSNYIGSLPQSNKKHKCWDSFFINERILPQINMAFDNGRITKLDLIAFNNLFSRLNEIFPDEPPALLHGDLWSGNFIIDEKGEPAIIDPAVYYGHREIELSFTKLFGGFDLLFYNYYNEFYPLENDFASREDIYNLYPLLVHLNLFGSLYLSPINVILKPFRA